MYLFQSRFVNVQHTLREQIISYFRKLPTKQAIYNEQQSLYRTKKITTSTSPNNENFQCRAIRIIISVIKARTTTNSKHKTHQQQISFGSASSSIMHPYTKDQRGQRPEQTDRSRLLSEQTTPGWPPRGRSGAAQSREYIDLFCEGALTWPGGRSGRVLAALGPSRESASTEPRHLIDTQKTRIPHVSVLIERRDCASSDGHCDGFEKWKNYRS